MLGFPLDTLAFLWLGALRRRHCRRRQRLCFRPRRFVDLAAPHRSAALGHPDHRLRRAAAPDHDLAATPPHRCRPAVALRRRRPYSASRSACGCCVYTDAGIMKPVLGVFLLAFGAYALLAPRLHTIHGRRPRRRRRHRLHRRHSWAASAAIPAFCRRSGRNCAAGRRKLRARSTSHMSSSSRPSRWRASSG